MICYLRQIYLNNQISDDAMSGVRSMHRSDEKCVEYLYLKPEGSRPLGI
jgi:hypothetical protein